MANHPAEGPGNALPFSRSITPGPFLFRSAQPRRVLSGRISRRRSTSLPLTDLNREALWDEAVLQNQRLSSPSPAPVQPTTVAAYSLDAVPSLISSASSTPSTAAFDVFPCTETLALSEAVTSLLPDPPLLSFDAAADFPLSIAHDSASYTSAYQHSYLESLFSDEKNMPSEEQTSYSGSYAPSPAMAAVSAMHSRATSAEPEQIQHAYSYPDYSSYPSASQAPGQPTYSYPSYVTQYAGSVDQRTYGDAYQHQASHGYMPNHQSGHYLSHEHPATINPSETQGERPKEHKTEARCWEHGCNGRVFSTHSNLLRHMREKSGNASKSTCPKCGAQFTRKTAMRGHMNNDKCGKKSGYTTPMDRSP